MTDPCTTDPSPTDPPPVDSLPTPDADTPPADAPEPVVHGPKGLIGPTLVGMAIGLAVILALIWLG